MFDVRRYFFDTKELCESVGLRMNPFIPVKATRIQERCRTSWNAPFLCNAPFVLFVGRLSMTMGGAW